MPTYRSITVSLASQYDLFEIPEFNPPIAPKDPFTTIPTIVDTDHAVRSVYIPMYPASQFWLCYDISPPNPLRLLYYFKLYINGRHIVSWGCGANNDFRGKTMFGVFESTQIHNGIPQSFFERRVLSFSPEAGSVQSNVLDSLNDVMEVKVFRSKGRKRIRPEIEEYQSVQQSNKKGTQRQADNGMKLVKGGFLEKRNPRRYYKYALYDPLDQPFATFRYYYRSWEQLEVLGLVSPSPSTVTSSIRSFTPRQRPVTPDSNDNVLPSLASLSFSLENTMARSAKSRATRPVRLARNNSNDSNNSTGTVLGLQSPDASTASENSTDSTDVSPFHIPRLNPLRMNRPPTPPPNFSPTKNLAQLPHAIPPTMPTLNLSIDSLNALNTLTPKASFASLIRTHLPDPDTSAFELKPPISPRQPRSSTTRPSRSSSMGALMDVVNSAKKRRSSRVSEVGSDTSSSVPSSEKKGEILDDLMAVQKKKEKEEKRKEKKRREEHRKLHLWEEI